MVVWAGREVSDDITVADAPPPALRRPPAYTVVQSPIVNRVTQRCQRDTASGTAAGSTSISPLRASHRTASAAVCSEV
jgi:hypothetical protein